jgi:hypothetical protein
MRRNLVAGLVVAATGLALEPAGSAQNQRETFTAFAVQTVARPGSQTGTVDISIDRWSTDAQREQLIVALKEGGPKALLKALQRQPEVGRIRTPDRVGYDLRYARQAPLEDGGRQIVIGTDRPIGYLEARNMGRTMDYPFTLVEMRLNANNEGEGKLLSMTKIYIDDKNNLVLENYGQQPTQLNQIRKLN